MDSVIYHKIPVKNLLQSIKYPQLLRGWTFQQRAVKHRAVKMGVVKDKENRGLRVTKTLAWPKSDWKSTEWV